MENFGFIAIDLGATSGRVIYAEYNGQKVKMHELTRFVNPIVNMGGHLFWDLAYLYTKILEGIRKAVQNNLEFKSIGIDSWGCDFAFFGKDGQLLSLPYCYRDSHTEGSQEKFFRKIPRQEIYSRTGIQFMDFNSLFQLYTLRQNGCSALDAAQDIMFIPDALVYMLTGEKICEYTVASTSQMLSTRTKDFDPDILAALGLDRSRFGIMTAPGTIAGKLTERVRKQTGLEDKDILVASVAGHDTASAVAAIPTRHHDYAYLSCGTWSLLGIETAEPVIDEASYSRNFTNEGGVDGTTRFLKNICGLWLLERCRKEFKDCPEDSAGLSALSETTSFNSLIDPDAPCFSHPDSMTGAIARYCRLTSQPVPHTPAEFCRCIFRSLALRYRQVIQILEKLSSGKINVLHVIGGGSQNRYLMQYTAGATGLEVIAGPSECTALGNVLLQMKAAGLTGGLDSMRSISEASVVTRKYYPSDPEEWEQAYTSFIRIQNLYNGLNNLS